MSGRPWNIVFLVGFIAYIAIRGVHIRRTKHNEKVLRRADRRDHALMFFVFVGSMLLPVLYLFTPLLGFADHRLPPFAPWCGALIMAAGLWLFWRSHTDLGQNWSVTLEVRRGHTIITRGVYRRIRHPMYASIWLFSLAQGLLLENWLAGWSALVTFAALYFVRAPREEQMMCDVFGEDYREYMRRTGRLVPRWRGKGIA
jgi:protein-S-isoprenylcysteine O-methyltransferase Ste14